MCLLMHPDEIPSVAADGAFKLVFNAWEALSTSQANSSNVSRATPKLPQVLIPVLLQQNQMPVLLLIAMLGRNLALILDTSSAQRGSRPGTSSTDAS